MNVAYVAVAPFISGAERCLQLILLNCKHNGIKPILITPSISPMRAWAQQNDIKHYSCDLSLFSVKKPWLWLFSQLKMFLIFLFHKIKCVHSNQIWSYPAIVYPSALLGIKRICHFRDPIDNNSNWWLKKKLHTAIFISKHIANQYYDHIPKVRANNVETIIDPVAFHQPLTVEQRLTKKSLAREKLHLDSDVFTFGFIGQVAPVKGLFELITYLGKLEYQNWQLVIAGKDPSEEQAYIKKCQQLITHLGLDKKVIFIGFIDNIRDFYLAIDVVTMFSLAEPLGLIPLEAAVNYTPSIATEVGGLPETIINGKTGWLVNFNNEKQLIDILNLSMSVDLLTYGSNAREWVEKVSLPQVYCQKLYDLYCR